MSGVIALITDFSSRDWYSGVMKGVILGINPGARVVDISHGIDRGDIVGAGFALKSSYRFLPEGTVFVVVVDPGVGTNRRILLSEYAGYRFLAPDNGILDFALGECGTDKARSVENREYWLETVSKTFHGRDIFAPVAAHLSMGVEPERFGPACKICVRLKLSAPKIEGGDIMEAEVINVDSFGNLITNIGEDARIIKRTGGAVIRIAGREIKGLSSSYTDVPEGELLAIYGSSGYMEISVNGGSAAEKLGVGRGAKFSVSQK